MQTNNVIRVKFKDSKRYIFSSKPFTFQSFLECVANKFDLPTMDVKVFDDSKTEVDEEAFVYLLTRPDLGVLEIVIPCTANIDDSLSSSSLGDEGTSESDDTAMLITSPPEKNLAEEHRLAKMIEEILKTSPGGEKIINEYTRTKGLSDTRRRDMVKILVAHLTNEHGTSPSRRLKEEYAKGIISLFPCLADPRSKLGYEHYYNAEDGSGYLAWRIKTLQKEASEGRMKRPRQPQTGGPTADRQSYKEDCYLTDDRHCQEAIALMKHTADEAVVKEKMKLTLAYRQKLLHDPKKSADILSVFSRFLDIPGLINQDFGLLFGDATSAKLLEKWSTNIKPKVIAQSRGLTQTSELQDLIQNAEATEVEEGWDSDMSSILMLVHLLPPSSQGRKRPGKISAKQACDHLVKFIKTGNSIQGHLDSIGERLQPYLLAVGPNKSRIHSWFIVIDQHALPCKASNSLACVDELFKAHFVFGTSYCQELTNVFSFLQTAVYDIDVETTKVNPRVSELRARILQ
ncbi:uncharacterized protein LOC127968947 [Carassius gibelio]|uniref:uncharacterized protein LOC127968947 n=1 Tax=Carassius gibelio TaxID=101364 RepID=UPI0022780EBA|nr:uncharacterized protein LOC127968947 [Carassius gibelio]XP_052426409.1 uncharacterized protein LOC127968947 [Carassius gibelio]